MLEKAAQEARETLWREHGTQFGRETMASLVRAVLTAIRIKDPVYYVNGIPNACPLDVEWNKRIDSILAEVTKQRR
jgi:hypothetical protein